MVSTVWPAAYESGLRWVLNHQALTLGVTIATVCLNILLFIIIPKGFFPQQDTGSINGTIQASQDISFDCHAREAAAVQRQSCSTIRPWTASFAFVGGGAINSGRMFIALKPLSERKISADQVIRAPAQEDFPSFPEGLCSCRHSRTFTSAAARATRNTNSRWKAKIWTSCNPGRP